MGDSGFSIGSLLLSSQMGNPVPSKAIQNTLTHYRQIVIIVASQKEGRRLEYSGSLLDFPDGQLSVALDPFLKNNVHCYFDPNGSE